MNYQSLGAQAVTRGTGRFLASLYPADRPYFRQDIAPKAMFDQNIDPRAIEEIRRALYVQDLTVMAVLETAGASTRSRRGGGFESAKRRSLEQVIVTGDSLERMNPDFSITVFRRDDYVTQRDGAGRPLLHITRELIDPLTLDEDKFAASKLDREKLQDSNSIRRMMPLYTICEWVPAEEAWTLAQEINDQQIHEATEEVSPYISTAYSLACGDHYGRGPIEENYGDLLTFDTLCRHMIDYAGMNSKLVPVIDGHSTAKAEDLAQPSGAPIVAHVNGGQVQDIAFLQVGKGGDFTVVREVMQDVERRLGRALMLEAETVRDSERTTAFEIQRVTLQQNEGMLAAAYAAISDQNQEPTARRALYQARQKKIIKPLPEKYQDWLKVNLLTGPAMLALEARAAGAMSVVEAARSIGPEALDYINMDVLFRMITRFTRVDEPGLIRGTEEVEELRARRAQAELAMQGATRAIDAAGTIAENAATTRS